MPSPSLCSSQILTVFYAKTRRIWPVILCHMYMDLAAVTFYALRLQSHSIAWPSGRPRAPGSPFFWANLGVSKNNHQLLWRHNLETKYIDRVRCAQHDSSGVLTLLRRNRLRWRAPGTKCTHGFAALTMTSWFLDALVGGGRSELMNSIPRAATPRRSQGSCHSELTLSLRRAANLLCAFQARATDRAVLVPHPSPTTGEKVGRPGQLHRWNSLGSP